MPSSAQQPRGSASASRPVGRAASARRRGHWLPLPPEELIATARQLLTAASQSPQQRVDCPARCGTAVLLSGLADHFRRDCRTLHPPTLSGPELDRAINRIRTTTAAFVRRLLARGVRRVHECPLCGVENITNVERHLRERCGVRAPLRECGLRDAPDGTEEERVAAWREITLRRSLTVHRRRREVAQKILTDQPNQLTRSSPEPDQPIDETEQDQSIEKP